MKKVFITAAVVVAIVGSVASISFKSSRTPPPLPVVNKTADRVLIEKGKRRLTLLYRGATIKVYTVALGNEPVGKKRQEGDGRTPEGIYKVDSRKRNSSYHRALHISYPNAADIAQARARGVSPGGDIMIHGLPNGMGAIGGLHSSRDWTLGCIAVTNQEIEEIWQAVPNGTTVEIVP